MCRVKINTEAVAITMDDNDNASVFTVVVVVVITLFDSASSSPSAGGTDLSKPVIIGKLIFGLPPTLFPP